MKAVHTLLSGLSTILQNLSSLLPASFLSTVEYVVWNPHSSKALPSTSVMQPLLYKGHLYVTGPQVGVLDRFHCAICLDRMQY